MFQTAEAINISSFSITEKAKINRPTYYDLTKEIENKIIRKNALLKKTSKQEMLR